MDINYLLFLQELREMAPAFVNSLLVFISEFVVGNIPVLFLMVVYWCIDKKAGIYLAFCRAGATAVNQIIKNTACIYRPWIRDARIHVAAEAASTATGYSFPSGHTTNAVAIYGGTAVWQRKRKWLLVPMIILIGLTAFSRNWLGAHTPQDVCTALVLSSIFLGISYQLLQWVAQHPGNENRILVIGLLIIAIMTLYIEWKPYPLDYLSDGSILVNPEAMKTDCYKAYGAMTGLLIGWYVERKWIDFQVDGAVKTKIIRFMVGAISAFLLEKGLSAVAGTLLGVNLGIFTSNLIVSCYIICIYPFVFKKLEF